MRQYRVRKQHFDGRIFDMFDDIIKKVAQCSSRIHNIIIDIDFLIIYLSKLIRQQTTESSCIFASSYLIDYNIFTGIFQRKNRIIFGTSIIRRNKHISCTKNTRNIIKKLEICYFDIRKIFSDRIMDIQGNDFIDTQSLELF